MEFPLLTMSMSSQYYHHWTNRVALSKSWELRKKGNYMYVLTFSTQDGKGKERWTKADGSHTADQLFAVTAVVSRPTKTLAVPYVFGQANTDGLVAYAQAMAYNANGQHPGHGPGTYQPEIGWNTLNWKSPVESSAAFAYGQGGTSGNFGDLATLFTAPQNLPHPQIMLNWQAKLMPVTRLHEMLASPQIPAEQRNVLKKLLLHPQLQTH
jgi:hypothetical protein